MKLSLFAAAAAAFIATTATAEEVPPLPPVGGFSVACSNVEQDFSRMPAGESLASYWEGPRFVSDLLVDPAHSFVFQRTLPGDSELFGRYAGSTVTYAAIVCYPTDASNTRADYVLPTGNRIRRMQRGGEAPIFPAVSGRFPVVLYSHGLAGSPISGDYIESVQQVASYGYVTIAVFHGDLRFADIDLDGFNDFLYALLNLRDFVAMQAVRPLSLSAALDAVLNHPDYRDHVDPDNVGGFGASLGGESLLLMAGAQLTTSLGQSSKQVIRDQRLKAAVGYVPYFGIDIYPAFGRDLKGLDGVTLPYLALAGTADTTAPISVVEAGVRRLPGTRQLVALTGLRHGYDPNYARELDTWMFTFLGGQLTSDPLVRATSARMTSVAGGAEDIQRLDYMAPSVLRGADEAIAVEFYNDSIDHYFVTAEAAEAAALDAGVPPGWRRTALAFKVRPASSGLGLTACRFFGTPPFGPNSHFFTIDAAECAKVRADPFWTFEALAFNVDPPQLEVCAPDRVPVLRLYNDGMGGQANHRYTTSRSESRQMRANGWIIEGVVFCAIP